MRTDTIKAILDELKEKDIIQEVSGCYEISHDILGARINEKRAAEDINISEVTRLVYDMERNKGDLNEQHLAYIKPFFDKLTFDESDKVRLYGYIKNCEHKIEQETLEKKKQVEIERNLRKKAISQRNVSRVLTIGFLLSTIFAWYLFEKDRVKTLQLLRSQVSGLVAANVFDGANQLIYDIQRTRKFAWKGMVDDQMINEMDSLERLLTFHITASNMEASKNFIILSHGSTLTVKKYYTDESGTPGLTKIFEHDFPRMSNQGIAGDVLAFWVSQNLDTVARSTQKDTIHAIVAHYFDAQTQKPTIINIDTVYQPTADFDKEGNLYYLKENKIWKFDRKKGQREVVRISDSLDLRAESSLIMFKFIKDQKTGQKSEYLLVTQRLSNTSETKNVVNVNLGYTTRIFAAANSLLLPGGRLLLYGPEMPSAIEYNLQGEKTSNFFPIDSQAQFDSLVNAMIAQDGGAVQATLPKRLKTLAYQPADSSIRIQFAADSSIHKIKKERGHLIRMEALDDFFVYIYQFGNDERIYFLQYNTGKESFYHIPKGWTLREFTEGKYLLFAKSGNSGPEVKAILLASPIVFDDDHVRKWMKNIE